MIVVFGSVAVDLVANVPRIPRPGETVLCRGYAVLPGSKGANQAVAAARAGSRVVHVATCGNDAFATAATSVLRSSGVDLAHLRTIDGPTGVCLVAVDPNAENTVIAASGANLETRLEQLERCVFGAGDTLILQREIPDRETLEAVTLAKSRGARVVLNSAPAGPLPKATLTALDVLIVNEHEAMIVAEGAEFTPSDPEDAVRRISHDYGCAAIVTLGAQGAVAWRDGKRCEIAAPRIVPVDTTGAGDTFVGAFAAALDQGMAFAIAVRRGVAAGSLSCTRPGAQAGIPSSAEIDEFVGGVGGSR
jgi:ribokinase